jgi:hypothetical protein
VGFATTDDADPTPTMPPQDVPTPTVATRPAVGPTDEDISRALDRLAKARVRLRDVTARVPVASTRRIEAIERAHRAVSEAATARARRADDPAADKTHALAEIAEVMALRREGFASFDDYQAQVAPTVSDPRLREALERAERELVAAQANWDEVKIGLLADVDDPAGGPVLDLTGETPTIHP